MVKKTMEKEEEKKIDSSMKSIFKGVRKRKWGKWVSEIRFPNSRQRIWLGSYDTPEKAARAFDAAQFCLRGHDADFNFPNNPPFISGGRSLSPPEIREAAARYANTQGEEFSLPGSEIRLESSSTSVSEVATSSLCLPGFEIRAESPSNSVSEVATSSLDYDLSFFDMIPKDFGEFFEFDDFSCNQLTEISPIEDFDEGNFEESLFLWDFSNSDQFF